MDTAVVRVYDCVGNLLALDNDFQRVRKTCSCHSSKTAGNTIAAYFISTRIVWTGTGYFVLGYNIRPDSLDFPLDNLDYPLGSLDYPPDTLSGGYYVL